METAGYPSSVHTAGAWNVADTEDPRRYSRQLWTITWLDRNVPDSRTSWQNPIAVGGCAAPVVSDPEILDSQELETGKVLQRTQPGEVVPCAAVTNEHLRVWRDTQGVPPGLITVESLDA